MLLEIFGVLTGFTCVWLAARSSIWNFPLTIISVFIYILIFYEAKLYADMGLQFYFLGMAIYGWYFWINRDGGEGKVKPVRRISGHTLWIGILLALVFTVLFGTFLDQQTDAHFPYLDSFCTGCSLFGSYLLSKRILENWLVWIIVDLIYLYLYISKELYLTTLLYVAYVFIAIMGYREWKKNWQINYVK